MTAAKKDPNEKADPWKVPVDPMATEFGIGPAAYAQDQNGKRVPICRGCRSNPEDEQGGHCARCVADEPRRKRDGEPWEIPGNQFRRDGEWTRQVPYVHDHNGNGFHAPPFSSQANAAPRKKR